MVYWLLTLNLPFPEENRRQLADFVDDSSAFPLEALRESEVSDNGIVFLKTLIVAQPKDRSSASKALGHIWIKEAETLSL